MQGTQTVRKKIEKNSQTLNELLFFICPEVRKAHSTWISIKIKKQTGVHSFIDHGRGGFQPEVVIILLHVNTIELRIYINEDVGRGGNISRCRPCFPQAIFKTYLVSIRPLPRYHHFIFR